MGAVLVLSSCSGAEPQEPSEAEVLFEEQVQPLFERECREGCHEPEGFNGDLFLGSGFDSDLLVSVPSSQASLDLVEPGDLEASYLWHKLQGTHRQIGGEGERMPYAGAQLAEADLDLVAEYILAL